MNKDQIHTILIDLTEEKSPAVKIDLWPAIQSRIQMNRSTQSKGFIMKKAPELNHKLIKPAFALLIVFLIGMFFLVIPQGRTLAKQIYNYINFHNIYPLSLAEAEEKAGFTLMTPSYLPKFLSFIGANYDEEMKIVNLFYHYSDPNFPQGTDGIMVREQRIPAGGDCELCIYIRGEYRPDLPPNTVGMDAKIETILIGDLTGTYMEGIGWMTSTDENGWYWNSTDTYRKTLRFQNVGLAIEIMADSYNLSREEVIAIAENIK